MLYIWILLISFLTSGASRQSRWVVLHDLSLKPIQICQKEQAKIDWVEGENLHPVPLDEIPDTWTVMLFSFFEIID